MDSAEEEVVIEAEVKELLEKVENSEEEAEDSEEEESQDQLKLNSQQPLSKPQPTNDHEENAY